jgi:FtsP/CotA-like multicopper oxidase with cupredoxin domain
MGVTLHVGDCDAVVHVSGGAEYPDTPIQDAIDNAPNGALIVVGPGTYWENPIIWKDVKLQGSGAESTIINGMPIPFDRSPAWRDKIETLLDNNDINLPAEEAANPFEITATPALLVLANIHGFNSSSPGLIDGFTCTGSMMGGGIYVRDAEFLRITNNRVISNLGTSGGGIVVGVLGDEANAGIMNNNLSIRHNLIAKNGGVIGGGGVTIFGGAEDYAVTDNSIVGNLSRWQGGGVAHYGLSNNGLIARNRIVSNEVASGDLVGGDGGGVFIGGLEGGSNLGAGDVTVLSNLIQGNLAGAGSGGGISAQYFNAQDVADSIDPNDWYQLNIFNNIVVNNVAALYGGGIFMKDVVKAYVINNTIANNDTSSTAANAFQGGPQSTPQPAGIVTSAHSADVAAATGQFYSNPVLMDDIIWGNRSFYWDGSLEGGKGGLVQNPDVPIWDLAVVDVPGPGHLDPDFCLLTQLAYADGFDYNDLTNAAADPNFASGYKNNMTTAAIPEEGGNFVTIRFEPIGIIGDYHITYDSPAVDIGGGLHLATFVELLTDYDGQIRPGGPRVDAGADEINLLPASIDLGPDVNMAEVAALVEIWLTGNMPQEPANGDLNGDGLVNAVDDAVFVEEHPGAVLLAAGLAEGSVYTQDPEDTDGIDTDGDGNPSNDYVSLHVAAGDGFINMADGRLQYIFGFSDVTGVSDANVIMNAMLGATFPSPTITVKEGQKLYLNLTNVGMMIRPDLFDPHTVHWHGFPQAASIFDGVPDASISVNMGATLTYFYNVVETGTFMWHCHVEATEHMQMGMLGNLYVLPKQNNLPDGTVLNPGDPDRRFVHRTGYKYAYNDGDGSTYYDVEYPLQISAFDPNFHDASYTVQPLPFALMDDKYPMLNGRGYPDTVNPDVLYNTASDEGFSDRPSQPLSSLITATQGQKILLRISSLSTTSFHTLSVPGIPMRVVGIGARILRGPDGKDLSYMTNSVDLGGGEAMDVILDTTGVAPGTYVLYATNLNHLSNNDEDFGGMMTEIRIDPPAPE